MGRVLNYDFCVKPLKCFKPCYVNSGTLLYRTLLYSRIWRFSSSAIFKFCWRSLRNCLGFWGYESDLRVASLHKATLQPQKKDSNTTSIFSSILYGLVSTVQAALINITACSSYPCNSYFQNWNSTCAEIANIFFCNGNKTKILFMLWAHCSQPLYLSVKIMVSPLPPLWKIICFAISWY